MADEEDDCMSDAFLNQIPDVRPGIPMVKRVKEAMKKEALQKEKNTQNRQKSFKEQERESREAALQSSLSSQNKGFALLQKMGYKAGQGLGKEGAGRVEPVPLNIKTVGMKVRKRTEREERQTSAKQGDLRNSQRACEQLDSQKGISVPRDSWYWPEVVKDEDEELLEEEAKPEGSDEEEELTPLDKLQFLASYLRGLHFYCIWCGTAFNDEEDLSSNCPGDTAADHDD
ncbi:G patch domain-containing protein 11-like [Sinocyclocheilus anshuiensis]|uniref:G patch domain-containing protein 11-like n=1 Tax=Sinocyclocheilus anshuiensis TaxID=1608454 RepID=UPI0007BA4311|nr:PREDICTED: G patch domain-containing protein 11-like [Sinocyclocheilus anshuiensis]